MVVFLFDRFFSWFGGKLGSIGWFRICDYGYSNGGENFY